MSDLENKIKSFKDYKKIHIKGYKSSSGSISNVILDVDTSYGSAKDQDRELLEEYKDIGDVKSIRQEVGDDEYDDLWVQAYNALHKSMHKVSTTPSKPKPETPIAKGVSKHNDNDKFYLRGFIKEREIINEVPSTKTSKKRKLTLFKDHMRKKFMTESYSTYSITNAEVYQEGETLVIEVKHV